MFNNQFAERIARSGIILSFKRGHIKKIRKEMTKHPKPRKMGSIKRQKIEQELSKLLKLGIISIKEKGFIYPNHIFILTSEHRSTKDRLIFDMSKLNKSINSRKFSMTKISEILPQLYENEFACSFDIKKAYYHVPINNKYKKYFSFSFNNIKYTFNSMPFGLNNAPYLFTKFISPILEYLRVHHKIIIFSYLDDFLLLDKSKTKLAEAIKISIGLFESLGFLINFDKSQLVPSNQIQFLGINFNLKDKKMRNSDRLINNVQSQARELIKKSTISRIELERFIGLGNFMANYMTNGRHFLHPIIKITNSYLPYTDRLRKFTNRCDLKEILKHWFAKQFFIHKLKGQKN